MVNFNILDNTRFLKKIRDEIKRNRFIEWKREKKQPRVERSVKPENELCQN